MWDCGWMFSLATSVNFAHLPLGPGSTALCGGRNFWDPYTALLSCQSTSCPTNQKVNDHNAIIDNDGPEAFIADTDISLRRHWPTGYPCTRPALQWISSAGPQVPSRRYIWGAGQDRRRLKFNCTAGLDILFRYHRLRDVAAEEAFNYWRMTGRFQT